MIETSWERGRLQTGGYVAVRAFGRWLRVALYYGTPAGSRMGVWRTRGGFSGELHGVNVRIGRRHVGPTLTMFAHSRRLRADRR